MAALVALDVALVAGVMALPAAVSGPLDGPGDLGARLTGAAGSKPSVPAEERGWAYCQTELRGRPVTPVAVAITYLAPELDRAVTADEIRSWLGEVTPAAVDVYKLPHKNGSRRVALELTGAKWPVWDQVAAGAQGEQVCARVRAALKAHGVGRPRVGAGDDAPARHDFEFIYARRPHLYETVEWVGTLDQVLEGDGLDALQAWLEEGAS